MPKQKTGKAAKREMRELIQLEGFPAAFQAALEVCKDKKAPAPARASAANAIFRAGGLFDRPEPGEYEEKDFQFKTRDELLADLSDAMDELREINGETAPLAAYDSGDETGAGDVDDSDSELFG